MSDQYGNNVDGEIRVPIKDFHSKRGWAPLTRDSWIETIGEPSPPVFVPLDSWTEYTFAYADGSISEERYKAEGKARLDLMEIRNILKGYGVDEEQWPVLMERTTEIVASSWRVLSV